MKKAIGLMAVMVLLSLAVQAQGNLQFNAAKFIKMNFTPAPSIGNQFIEQVITVPSGKVWKIESVMGTFVNNNTGNANPTYANSVIDFFLDRIKLTQMPVWLPAGTYTLRMVYTSSVSGTTNEANGAVSVIEFNLVQ